MKQLSFCLVAILFVCVLVCCKKQAFKDGVGLYSEKQYHCFSVVSQGDTEKLANVVISISDMSNNYLSWNAITFHLNSSSDSLATYINDSSIGGVYTVLYNLNYYPKTDSIVVFGNSVKKIWRSY